MINRDGLGERDLKTRRVIRAVDSFFVCFICDIAKIYLKNRRYDYMWLLVWFDSWSNISTR